MKQKTKETLKTVSKGGIGILSTYIGGKVFTMAANSLVETDSLNEVTAAGAVTLGIEAGIGSYMIGEKLVDVGFDKIKAD